MRFDLAYFRPSSGLNEELARLYHGNLFAVVRQLRYSEQNENSLDLVALPQRHPPLHRRAEEPAQRADGASTPSSSTAATATRASRCWRTAAAWPISPSTPTSSTSPPICAARRRASCRSTRARSAARATRRCPPTQDGYPTDYLWGDIWARDSVLDLVRQFIHEVEDEDEDGKKTGERFLIFPRYQQLDAVRRLVADARAARRGAALSDPAFGRQRQELHHRLAGPPAFDAPRQRRPPRLRLHRRHHRPARPRPAVAAHRAPVRADAGRGGEYRHHLEAAQAGAGRGQDDHRHHAAEVPGHRRARSASCRGSASPSSSTRPTPRSRAKAPRA